MENKPSEENNDDDGFGSAEFLMDGQYTTSGSNKTGESPTSLNITSFEQMVMENGDITGTEGVAVPLSLQESLHNLEHDVAEAQKDGITETEVKDGDKEREEESDYNEEGVVVPPSLQEELDNLEHDIADAQKDDLTETEGKDSDKEHEEEKTIPDCDEEGVVVPPSLQEELDNLEHDVADAQKDNITETEVKDSDKEHEEESDYNEEDEVVQPEELDNLEHEVAEEQMTQKDTETETKVNGEPERTIPDYEENDDDDDIFGSAESLMDGQYTTSGSSKTGESQSILKIATFEQMVMEKDDDDDDDDLFGGDRGDDTFMCLETLEPLAGIAVQTNYKYHRDPFLGTPSEETRRSTSKENKQEVLLLKDLVNELQEVVDWFYLGMCLKVPIPTLLTIKQDLRNTDECRIRMLKAWMNQEEEPAWSKVVAALHEMKKTALAEKIGSKFDVTSVPEPESEPVTYDETSLVTLDLTNIDSTACSHELPRDLLDILKGVKSWCTLGLCLGIPMEVLEEIKSKRMRAKKRSRKIMTTWMEKEINAWEKLVRALDEVGATSLAYAVAQQYGVQVVTKSGSSTPSVDGIQPNSVSSTQSVEASLKDLVSELQEVTDWYYLGLCLGVPFTTLQSIKQDYRLIEERKREVLLAWSEQETPTWVKVVNVLVEMKKMPLAQQIAKKYDVPVPSSECTTEGIQNQGETALLQPAAGGIEPSLNDLLRDLLRELQQVIEWRHLGQLLGLPESDLEKIYQENETTEDCRREMLLLWMERDPNCTWKKVVDALIEMRADTLAAEIASRYGVHSLEDQDETETTQKDIPCPEGLQLEGVAMKDLLSELQEVTDWFKFGVEVGIQESKLKEIKRDYLDTEDRKRAMLFIWVKKEVATWAKVIHALAIIGMHRLALAIASRYGVAVPPSLQEALEHVVAEAQKDVIAKTEGTVAPPEELDNLEHDEAEAKKDAITEATDSDKKHEEEPGCDEKGVVKELDNPEHEVAEEQMVQKDTETETKVNGEPEKIIPDYEENGGVKFKDLVNELKEVTDWFALGVYLGLDEFILKSVQEDCVRTDDCRREMLGKWMKEQEATWSKVVHALVEMKMYPLAVQIASKYKAPIAKSAVDAMQGEIPEGELKILEVVQDDEEETDSESSSEEEEDLTGVEKIEMKDLIQELEEVTEWDYLGTCLGLPEPTLQTIRRDHRKTENRKREVLMEWVKIKVPTWRRVVCALLEMGMEVLAKRIAGKYGIPLPKKVRKRPHPKHHEEEQEEEEPEKPPVVHQLPAVHGFNMMDAFWNGNVIELIAESNGYPVQIRKGEICGFGPFSGPQSQFTVLTPLGAPRGEIMLQNVFWPEIYIDITGRVFKTTDIGDACRLRVHIGPDNLVSFEAVCSPGQYLAISQTGTALDPRRVILGCIETKFFVRVHRQVCQYMTTVMTRYGRPSVANLLQDESIVQLYIRKSNLFLGINNLGNVFNTCHFANPETHLKVKDYGMGMYSFSSNNYKGCCLRIHITWMQEHTFNTGEDVRIQHKTQQGKGELSLEANFYLKDNPDGTVSFESVASPNNFLAVQDGTTLLKNFSIFIVNIEHSKRNKLQTVTRTAFI